MEPVETPRDSGEAEILAWRSACEAQIAMRGGDPPVLAAVQKIAKQLLEEHRQRNRDREARL